MREADLLERLLEGDALPESDVPEELDKLALLADLVAHTELAAPVVMRAEARDGLRSALIREANLRRETPPPLLSRIREQVMGQAERWQYSSRAALAGGVAAFALSTGGVAAAAEASLPGDLLYGLKLGAEDLLLSFADAGPSRGGGLLGQAGNRVDEARTAADRGEMAVAADALRLADQHARDGAQQYLTAYLDGGDTAILAELGDWVVVTNRALDLLPSVTGDAASALGDLRTTLNRIGQRIEVLTTGACRSCDLGAHDDPDAPPTQARGLQADGTPPLPPGNPLDLTYIPPAGEEFRACPCTGTAPAGSARPGDGSSQSAPTPTATPTTGPPPGQVQDPDDEEPGSGGEPSEQPGGSGEGPLPTPLPDVSPVTDQLPDPVRTAVEEIIESIPTDTPEPSAPAATPQAPPTAQ